MTSHIDEIEVTFFRYLAGELSIGDFEQWLYATPQVEACLGGAAYYELLSFRYQQPAAGYELTRLIHQFISPVRFHAWQMRVLLQSLIDGIRDPVNSEWHAKLSRI